MRESEPTLAQDIPQAERVYLAGENHDDTDPNCSPWGWVLPNHIKPNGKMCRGSNTLYRETEAIPTWPDEYRGRTGTVPPMVTVICDFCHQQFTGLGPE